MPNFLIYKERMLRILSHPIILISVIIINLFWGILGIIAQWHLTDGVSFLLWLFIPDCPLYSLLFAIFLLDRKRIKEHQSFMWILTFGLIKFSLAAPIIFWMYPSRYYAPPIFGVTLPNIYPFDYFHLFLLFQGFFIAIYFLEKSLRNFTIAFSWLFLNDFIDFIFLTFSFYDIAANQLDVFITFYFLINVAILVIGLFFVFDGIVYIKDFLGVEEPTMTQVPVMATSISEKNKEG